MAESSGKLGFAFKGNGNGNGNGHTAAAYRDTFKESGGLIVGEMVSMGVSLGVVAIADELAPNLVKKVTKFVAKNVVEPFQDTIEWGLSKTCKLKECQVDYSKSRSERAEQYAHFLTIFGAAFVPSMLAKIGTRMGMNKLLGVKSKEPLTGNWWKDNILPTKHDWHIILRDEGVHLGAIALMNTAFAKETDKALTATETMFQKTFGWDDAKAKRVAEMFVIWEIPNWLGLASGIHCITSRNFKDAAAATHAEKLALKDAATPHHTLGT